MVVLEKIVVAFKLQRVHGGHGYGVRNELRDAKLDFATTYDLILRNI